MLELTGILESFNTDQYVNFHTHIHSHSVDLFFSKGCDALSLSASDMISDYFSVAACKLQQTIVVLYCTLSETGS